MCTRECKRKHPRKCTRRLMPYWIRTVLQGVPPMGQQFHFSNCSRPLIQSGSRKCQRKCAWPFSHLLFFTCSASYPSFWTVCHGMQLRQRHLLEVGHSRFIDCELAGDCRICECTFIGGPQAPYETTPHMKQHCCFMSFLRL